MQEYRMLYLPEFDTSSLRNSEQTIETNHDSSTDFVMENCKSNCDHLIVNNMSCCIGFQFFVCLILLIDCWNSFWIVCFCSELIVIKLSLNTSWIMFNTRGMLQWFDSRSKVYSWECLTSKQSDFEELDTKFTATVLVNVCEPPEACKFLDDF